MFNDKDAVPRLYKKLLDFYPRAFREQLAESMEQTFKDLYMEKRRAKGELFGFVLWTFGETSLGVLREYLVLFSPGDIMQAILKTSGSSALIGFLLILPFMIMEIVNGGSFNEGFPFALFFVLWLNLFAISLILLPILRTRRTGNRDRANPTPIENQTLLTSPGSAALISVALLLAPGILPLLESAGWLSMDRLFNGPNPEVAYLPGQVLSLVLIVFPVMAGVVAARPIVSTLQAGGSLFTHPIHLMIVIVIAFLFAAGVVGMIVDQWPCFMGVPNCD